MFKNPTQTIIAIIVCAGLLFCIYILKSPMAADVPTEAVPVQTTIPVVENVVPVEGTPATTTPVAPLAETVTPVTTN